MVTYSKQRVFNLIMKVSHGMYQDTLQKQLLNHSLVQMTTTTKTYWHNTDKKTLGQVFTCPFLLTTTYKTNKICL